MSWRWSDRVEQARWIAARQLARGWVGTVPSGFAAYARLLHPLESAEQDGPPVRWAQVAGWSGVPLEPKSRFWQIALPERLPPGPIPGDGVPPSDVLGVPDGRALGRLLRPLTRS